MAVTVHDYEWDTDPGTESRPRPESEAVQNGRQSLRRYVRPDGTPLAPPTRNKARVRISTSIDSELFERLRTHAESSGMRYGDIFEAALARWLDEAQPHDDSHGEELVELFEE